MAFTGLPQWAPPPRLSCFTCKGLHSTEWCTLGSEKLEEIDKAKTSHRFKAGEVIYHQGDPCGGIYCIETGTVAVRKIQADGNSKILRVAEAGSTLGYSDFFGGPAYRSSTFTMSDATICHIPNEPLLHVLNHNPALGLAFLTRSASDLAHADTMLLHQALLTVRARMAYLLLAMKDRHGTFKDDGSILISLPMSWQEAAELVGARPETVSRTMQALVKDGVIQVSGHDVTVPDLDTLLDEIEGTEA